MHPVKTGAKRKRTVLVLVMALGVGLPPPAQAYLLDFTVVSVNPGVSHLLCRWRSLGTTSGWKQPQGHRRKPHGRPKAPTQSRHYSP